MLRVEVGEVGVGAKLALSLKKKNCSCESRLICIVDVEKLVDKFPALRQCKLEFVL